jgi:hypothetical protein
LVKECKLFLDCSLWLLLWAIDLRVLELQQGHKCFKRESEEQQQQQQ